ncbi:hypothetical protein [Nostoc sp. CMAA1605]|uniref:hypothetical protein n=1 Tax=Nostoc sp. CMAA1605 TaxID=2055159 RepID=UPI001F365DBF|nr:hypothetical protein [Nostoc sp. CMAA1605]MCF4967534.1 hypothetical protein [Nostoc sp. CMAA1605]
MGVTSRYWQLVKIDGVGRRQVQEITPAKVFFAELFPAIAHNADNDLPDAEIQRELLQVAQDAPIDRCLLAQRCLLCLISWQIEQACLQIAEKFGTTHGFSSVDLLPYVLDDDGSIQPSDDYQCSARKILQTFDPQQSSLTTWTTTRVKHDAGLNKFLLECGVYLVSDWAILNDTRPHQIQRIFTEFYSLTPHEIQQAQQLLESYHAIYRTARLQQRAQGKGGKCSVPTTQQLQQIATLLASKTGQNFKSEIVLTKLQQLADRLRQYRIYIRGGYLPTESLDNLLPNNYIDTPKLLDNEDEPLEFLQLYRPQFLSCLEQALAVVTQSRVDKLQRKKGEKAKQFLTALQLFHCQNLSMTDIAARVGLRAQDAVTRLLKLKEFRNDVSQQLLMMLCDRVLELAKKYSQIESLTTLEQQIKIALNEQVESVIREAEIQAQTARPYIKTSLFNDRLCRYLDVINEVK